MRLDEIEKAERRWQQRTLFKDQRNGQRRLLWMLIALAAAVLCLYLFGPDILGTFTPWRA